MIGIAPSTPAAWIAAEAAKARAAGSFGAGLMAWALPGRPELLDVVLAEKPDVLAISFGDPTPYVEQTHAVGSRLVAQVQDAASAQRALDAGVDAVVAQGTEAGGHTGGVGTLPLLQIVLELAEPRGVPVLAAGGIATGRGIAAALAMGCAGVWVGTPFVATAEALGSEAAKSRVLRAKETETVHTHVFDILTNSPWPDEYPGRALVNEATARWHGREDELTSNLSEVQPAFEEARRRDDYATAYIYAGQSVGLVREVLPAGELVASMMAEAEVALRAARGLLG
jgi:nitronate monooxygenase